MLQRAGMVNGGLPQRQRRERTRFESDRPLGTVVSHVAEAILQPRWSNARRSEGCATMASTELQLGPRIRSLRQARRVTLRELAERAGVTESFLSQVER